MLISYEKAPPGRGFQKIQKLYKNKNFLAKGNGAFKTFIFSFLGFILL